MKKQRNIETMLVLSMGFILLFYIFHWKYFILISLILGLTGLFFPWLTNILTILWLKLATALSYVVPKLLFSIVFYIFLFPLATISKLFSKDSMLMKRGYKSYFIDRNINFSKDSFEKTW